jgi:RNA recognition motif-containing protein
MLNQKHFLKDKEVEVREYQDDEDKFIMKCYRKTKKIFVGGLSLETTKSSLGKYFEQFGPIQDISIPINYYSK